MLIGEVFVEIRISIWNRNRNKKKNQIEQLSWSIDHVCAYTDNAEIDIVIYIDNVSLDQSHFV